MYSKYSNFSIPQNYSGSRFSTTGEPQTKTHRGEIGGATRRAHSPSFAPVVAQDTVDEPIAEDASIAVQEDYIEPFEEPEIEEYRECDEYEECTEREESKECFVKSAFDLSSLKRIFEGLEKDQLLILGLIILLITDSDKKNDDVVLLLALLLLS